jgi:hypothetical protein
MKPHCNTSKACDRSRALFTYEDKVEEDLNLGAKKHWQEENCTCPVCVLICIGAEPKVLDNSQGGCRMMNRLNTKIKRTISL